MAGEGVVRMELAPRLADLADADTWSVADVDQISGRGLGIVRRLADDVSVARTTNSLSITARCFY